MMAASRPRRGDVWLVDFGSPIGREQAGRRPAVIVSDDLMNTGPSGLAIVVPMTSRRRDLPSHVEIDDDAGVLINTEYADILGQHRLEFEEPRLAHVAEACVVATALAVAFTAAFAVVVAWAAVLIGAAAAISISSATGTSALAIVSPAIGCFV